DELAGQDSFIARVGELIDQCAGALAARCEQAEMQLVIQRDGDADQPITTDPATVERVLFNLVDNACKYASSADDKRVHLEVRVSSREVEMLVRDHGPGIERAERGRIFRPFVRGQKQADGSISGLGLGLALAKGLATQLGGGLELAAADSGAAFSLSLPLGT
ncbi:MAG: sensor histidine kinase, partial [Phycisphaerales bacterium]